LTQIFERYEGATPRRQHRDWKSVLAESGLFEQTKRLLFSHAQPVDADTMVARVLSVSFMGALPPDEQAKVDAEVRALADGVHELHYMTELYLGRRV
jgi:hypothetical protein